MSSERQGDEVALTAAVSENPAVVNTETEDMATAPTPVAPSNEGGVANNDDINANDDEDSSSSSSDSEGGSNHGDEVNLNGGGGAMDDDDLLLGIDTGAAAASSAVDGGEAAATTTADNEDLSPKKEKKSKDKKSKKDKDKKSKKDKHKDKKGKDKKSKKDKHKKSKHGKRDRGGDGLDAMDMYVREAADNGVERRRRRKERQNESTRDDDGHGHDKQHDAIVKRGTTNVELKHLQALLEASLDPTTTEHREMGYDVNSIHEVLLQLASLEVTYDNLVSTRIGTTVGKLLSAEYHDLMQAPFANAILKYWFLRLAEDRRNQLVRVDELENASVASQYDDREAPEDMATLNRIGVDIEKTFSLDELDAAGVVDASQIAGELSDLLAVDEDVRELVLNRLRAPDNKALRVKLLKGEVQAAELVNHPDVVGLSETQRRRDVEQEEKYLHNRTL